MNYWMDTVETIPDGVGFSLFSGTHFGWLAAFVVFTTVCCLIYRRLGEKGRRTMRLVMVCALFADELFKMAVLFVGGRYKFSYLPLHLCSINIFTIAVHLWKPGKVLNNFLYAICIPGALAALLFPSWTPLPAANLMHIHSATIHILLAAYPIMLLAGGEIRPDVRCLPRCFLILGGMAVLVLGVNLLLDTNFMFLMYAKPGNPLYYFEGLCGSHLVGFPVIITAVMLVMYGPMYLLRKVRAKK